MIKSFLKKSSTIIGLLYMFSTILFALVFYYFIPVDQWRGSNPFPSYLSALYYSIITITTFGFGNVYPQGVIAQFLTCLEVLVGIVLIGLYLNYISEEHAERINIDSEQRLEKLEKENALSILSQHISLVIPCFRSYLLECYEMVTPNQQREFPNDVLIHKFEWTFNDLHGIYNNSMLLINKIETPIVKCYFREEHKLVTELRYLLSNSELKYTPELRKDIVCFINECNSFFYEPSIIGVLTTQMMGAGKEAKKASLFCSDIISEYKGNVVYQKGNFLNQFVALYDHLEKLIPLSQKIASEMNNNVVS